MKNISVLSNGLRVVSDYIEHVETVSLGAWFAVGARFEEEANNGISHVLEHMAFKGTQSRSALDISLTIENVGGYLNAYTSRETTAYYARVLKDHAALAVDILGDILQNSVFDEKELAKEKNVIIQEIGQTLDTPDDVVFDYFQQTCFPNQAMGRSILGPAENVSSFTSDRVKNYMKTHYSADRMVFSAAGNIKHEDLVDLVEKSFSTFKVNPSAPKEDAVYVGGDFRQHKDLEQVHVVLGFKGVGYGDDLYFPQMLSATLLGGGMSSRLFQEIREKRGLVYTISSYASPYNGGGVFAVYAGTGQDQVHELLPVTLQELYKLPNTVVEQELNRAKAQLKASVMMGLESTTNRCERLSHQMLTYGKLIESQEVIDKINSVSIADIKRYMEQTLSSNPTLTTLGPIDQVMSYEELIDYRNKL